VIVENAQLQNEQFAGSNLPWVRFHIRKFGFCVIPAQAGMTVRAEIPASRSSVQST
jgi:hypothetical protein